MAMLNNQRVSHLKILEWCNDGMLPVSLHQVVATNRPAVIEGLDLVHALQQEFQAKNMWQFFIGDIRRCGQLQYGYFHREHDKLPSGKLT